MSIEEFINEIDGVLIDSTLISEVEKPYEIKLPDYIGKILSFDKNGISFGDNKRLLSLSEVINAVEDLHVDFIQMRKIPLFDTGDNDFIVYSFEDGVWELFNIVDKCVFHQSSNLEELLLM